MTMTRACLVTIALALTSSVALAGKPKLSVLGLEVLNKSGGAIEKSITVAAHDLTQGLRGRIDATGAYAVATTGDRELIDEKLRLNCEDEKMSCMIDIANDLKADVMMYGSVEKTTEKGKQGYLITVKLLSVAKRAVIQTHAGFVPFPAASNEQELKSWARSAFNKLTGQDSRGTLVIRANVDQGTVLIDDVEKDTLKSGMATIPLDEGRYRLAIETQGYKRWELGEPLTIRAGQTTSKAAELEKRPKDEGNNGGGVVGRKTGDELKRETSGSLSHHKSYNGLKALAVITIGLGLGAAGAATYEALGPIAEYKKRQGETPAADADKKVLGHENCSGASSSAPDVAVSGSTTEWRKACAARTRQFFEIPAAVGLLTIGISTAIYVATRGEVMERNARRPGKRKDRAIALDPVLAPDQAGANLRISW
jgi:hypothetical protein